MGLLDRVFGRSAQPATPVAPKVDAPIVLGGRDTLEVVGESHYQESLWRLAGGFTEDYVRCPVTAVLVPEPENRHDGNAVRVMIQGLLVGYLSRHDAATYLRGIQQLMDRHRTWIALSGQIVGGGQRDGRLGMLGVFLDHDPTDFGLRRNQFTYIGELRTGLSQAVATDAEDDSYDLSWLEQLSGRHAAHDIVVLRKLLVAETDPIDRHFMLVELGKCLYKSRDAFASALAEFDAVCVQHDAEMGVIRPALHGKFGAVPMIEMYRQAAIRCQKARDWHRMGFWAERGLAIYGADAARPEAVEDLRKRLVHAHGKAAVPEAVDRVTTPSAADGGAGAVTEILICSSCGGSFERVRSRGRKPLRCNACRDATDYRRVGAD